MPDVDEFVRKVIKSGVVDQNRLRDALRALPANRRDRPEGVADSLVQGKLLTPFQARKLLTGPALGLRLGHYVIQAPVGKGGMGTVYLALDTRNGRAVAIKVLTPNRLRSTRHLARFRREMELSHKLRHPNIAQAEDVGEVQGVHFLALEFIPGVTLHRLVTREGPLAPPRAARLFAEIASALAYAHDQGLIHRDIKPANIMVTPDDHAKVLDLGLAMIEGEEVEDPEIVGGRGYVVGSVEYIAPEQTRDPTQVDARADLYAFGCTLYFALAGRGPFSVGDLHDKIRAHRRQAAEPIQNRNPDVPDGLAKLIHRLLAKSPADRPESAEAVRRELLRYSDPAAMSTGDSFASFQFFEPVDIADVPDTLGEAFQFETLEPPRDDDELTIDPRIVRRVTRSRQNGLATVFLIVTAVTMTALLIVAVVLFVNLR